MLLHSGRSLGVFGWILWDLLGYFAQILGRTLYFAKKWRRRPISGVVENVPQGIYSNPSTHRPSQWPPSLVAASLQQLSAWSFAWFVDPLLQIDHFWCDIDLHIYNVQHVLKKYSVWVLHENLIWLKAKPSSPPLRRDFGPWKFIHLKGDPSKTTTKIQHHDLDRLGIGLN